MMDKIPCDPSIGTDVEWLLYNEKERTPVVACGLVGGTKEAPLDLGLGYAVQEDNVMVEWNTPPATRWDVFYHNVSEAIQTVKTHVKATVGAEYTIKPIPEWEFSPLDLESPQARTFGCDPDYDAYLGGAQRPDGAMGVLGNYRTCGGHIHLGGDFQCPDFVAALFAEYYIGVLGCLPMDHSTMRSKWYGQPGIFRSKPYGIEYRTPSNAWTGDSNSIEYIAMYGHRCAEFLTNTPADRLQKIFRSFPWLELRKYMSGEARTALHRKTLVTLGRDAGMPQ